MERAIQCFLKVLSSSHTFQDNVVSEKTAKIFTFSDIGTVTGGSRGRPTGPKSANGRAKSHFGRPLSKLI